MDLSEKAVDFLVIGGGVAGLRAAIELAPKGSVLVLTKDKSTESTTGYAQGGIAVALSDEDVEQAIADLEAGGRHARLHTTRAIDELGTVCAEIDTEVYLRIPREDQKETSAF